MAAWMASRSGMPNTAPGPLKLRTTPILTASADRAPLDSIAAATADKTSETNLRMASLPGNYLCFPIPVFFKELSQSASDPHHLSTDLIRLRLQQELDQRGDVARTRHSPQGPPPGLHGAKFLA